jgi:hypothetical protein
VEAPGNHQEVFAAKTSPERTVFAIVDCRFARQSMSVRSAVMKFRPFNVPRLSVQSLTHSAAAVDEQRIAFRRGRSSGFSLPKLP